jgi:hypothetical protein
VLNDLPPAILPLLIANSTQRRGKGGRQPAQDPRLDPKIDPKRAKRILANRMSAARWGARCCCWAPRARSACSLPCCWQPPPEPTRTT